MEILIRCLTLMVEVVIFAGVGFLGRKSGLLGEEAQKGGTQILLWICAPASILYAARSVTFNAETLRSMSQMLLLTFLSYAVIIPLSWGTAKALRLPDGDRAVLVGSASFKNNAFLGLPLGLTVLGEGSAFYIALSMAVFNVMMWTFGVWLYSGGHSFSLKKMLVNPALLSCVAMVLLSLFRVPLPEIVWTTFKAGGDMCTPLSLLIVGMMLASAPFWKSLTKPFFLLTSAFSLFVCPLLMMLLVRVFRPAQAAAAVLLLISAVPSATMNPIVAAEYGGDGVKMSTAVVHSMVLGLVTMPVLISLLLAWIGYSG